MKVCEMCGAQNDDVFTKCSVCGADLPSMNSQDGDDEKTVLIDPDQASAQPSGQARMDRQMQDRQTHSQQHHSLAAWDSHR